MNRSNETTRAIPNGYICAQYVEKTSFYLAEALVDLETVLNATLNKEDIYRLVGRAVSKVHRANETNEIVKEIYSRKS